MLEVINHNFDPSHFSVKFWNDTNFETDLIWQQLLIKIDLLSIIFDLTWRRITWFVGKTVFVWMESTDRITIGQNIDWNCLWNWLKKVCQSQGIKECTWVRLVRYLNNLLSTVLTCHNWLINFKQNFYNLTIDYLWTNFDPPDFGKLNFNQLNFDQLNFVRSVAFRSVGLIYWLRPLHLLTCLTTELLQAEMRWINYDKICYSEYDATNLSTDSIWITFIGAHRSRGWGGLGYETGP